MDCFLVSWATNTGARMKSTFSLFHEMVLAALKKVPALEGAEMYQTSPPEVEVCSVENLECSVLICDWERDAVEERHRRAMDRFDSFDIILVAGDSDTTPFDPRLAPLVTLSKMACYSGTPLCVCGAPALSTIYSICSKGQNFNFIGTGKASRLKKMSRYGDRAAFVDELGDLYHYDAKKGGWTAALNTGLHLLGTSRAASNTLKATEMFAKSVEQRVRNTSQEVDSVIVPDRDCLNSIKSCFSEHYLVSGLTHGNSSFLSTGLKEWAINRTISVPRIGTRDIPLAILAEGSSFPVLLEFGSICIYAAEVNSGKTCASMKKLVENFILHNAKLLVHSPEGYISRSILRFVFEEYPVKDDGQPCKAISKSLIKSEVEMQELSVYSQEFDLEKSMSLDPYKWGNSKTFYPPSPQTMTGSAVSEQRSVRTNQRSQGIPFQAIRKIPSSVDNSNFRLLRIMDVCKIDSMSTVSMDGLSLGGNNSQVSSQPERPSQPAPTTTRPRNQHVRIIDVPEEDEEAEDNNKALDGMSPITVPVPKIEGFEAIVAENRRSMQENGWLPHQSPRSVVATDRPTQSKMLGSVATGTVSMTSRASSKSNYKRLVAENKTRVASEKEQPYKGIYTERYQSQYDKQRSDQSNKDNKWVSNKAFRTTFGSRAGIPLRKPAQLGPPSVEYKENPEAIGLKVGDAITLRRTDKSKWVDKKPWVSVKKD